VAVVTRTTLMRCQPDDDKEPGDEASLD